MPGTELTRRETLRNGVIASSALVLGATAASGGAVAKNGGTGFLARGGEVQPGTAFTTIDREFTRVRIGVECEADGRTRSLYTKYRIAGPEIFSEFFWVEGANPLAIGDEFEALAVRECGTLSLIDGEFEADKVTFRPVGPKPRSTGSDPSVEDV